MATSKEALEALEVNYVNLCAVTLLIYDTLLNVGDEVKYIWNQNWSFVKCIYIASKYLAFIDGALTIDILLRPGRSSDECMIWYRAMTYILISGMALAQIILLLRTWAIWGLSRYILAYLLLVDTTIAILSFARTRRSLGEIVFASPSPIPILRPCFPIFLREKNGIYIDYLCVMLAECNVLFLMLWRGYARWRGSENALINILYRDGIIYFMCLFIISGVNVMFYTVQNRTMYWMLLVEPQRIVHAILAARLVLNMRLHADRSKRERNGKSIVLLNDSVGIVNTEMVRRISTIILGTGEEFTIDDFRHGGPSCSGSEV